MIDAQGKPVIDPEKTGFKTVPQGSGGVYCADNNIGPRLKEGEERTLTGVASNVTDPVNAGRLWRLAEELTGCRLD